MLSSNGMNSSQFRSIPQIWFVRRREYLETHYQEVLTLRDKITPLSVGQNIIKIQAAAESLRELNSQIDLMDQTFGVYASLLIDEYDPYNRYELQRIKELTIATANHLDALAKQLSWGGAPESTVSQVKRNLIPLIKLIERTLNWIEERLN